MASTNNDALQGTTKLSTLTDREDRRLRACDGDIRRGDALICRALTIIHDEQLYRAEFRSFEEYCELKLGLHRSQAYRILAHGSVLEHVSESGVTDAMAWLDQLHRDSEESTKRE